MTTQPASPKVLTGNRLERLLDLLAQRLHDEPLPPLCNEVVIVPGQGMARWVTLELARRHGVAAGLELPFPGAFLQTLCARAATPDDAATDLAFTRPALELRLFRLLGEARLQRDLGSAGLYCQDDPDQHRRLQLAARVAHCLDDYQLYRDDVLLQWQHGAGPDLPHAGWQRRLWQELLREKGALPGDTGTGDTARRQGLLFAAPAGRGAELPGAHRLERLRRLLADPDRALSLLPPRLSVFGLATLPPAFLDLLVRIAAHVEVTVYAPKATPQLFSDLRRDRSGATPRAGSGNPLLAAWGQQSRAFFDLLLDRSPDGDSEDPQAFVDPGTDTLLHTLQHDLLHLQIRGPGGDVPPRPCPLADESLRLHSVHSPLREMEVVRDQILQAMGQDPTMTPADVLVLLPDIGQYAPYVHAVFRPVQKLLPFHVADRSPASDLPLPATLLRLFALARGRLTAPEVLLLLEEPAVARRFAIARPDLLMLRSWVRRTRIRWGLSGEHRQRDFGLPADDGNTWRQGLDRLVLGVATGRTEEPVLGLLPAGDSSAGRIDLLGRFVTFVDVIGAACQALARPHALSQWADLLDRLLDDLFLPVDDDELQGLHQLRATARRLRELQDVARLREELSARAFATWLENDLAEQGAGRGFLTGAITFAALRPMRTVPTRLLCIAGLGDGAFPRRTRRAVFDLIENEPRPGDRCARDDDRQLFLDAMLAARDRLVLSWVGRSQKDNSACAPSPVIAELLDHLERACTVDTGTVRDQLVVEHPLQSFSPRYAGGDQRLFTYGGGELGAALPTALLERAPATPVDRDAGAGDRADIDLADLLAFWRHPTRWYCQRALDLRFPAADDRDDDAEPFVTHKLDEYGLMQSAVLARLAGRTDALQNAAALGTGMLPLGAMGQGALRALDVATTRFGSLVAEQRGQARSRFRITGADYAVTADLDGLRDDALVLWRPARLKAKDCLRAYIQHAVLCLAREQGFALPTQTILLALGREITAPACWPAQPHVDTLVAGYRQGMRAPLPFFERASSTYATQLQKGRDVAAARAAARRAWRPATRADNAWHHDLPDPFLEFCFRDQDPTALPEFAQWAERVLGTALTFFKADS